MQAEVREAYSKLRGYIDDDDGALEHALSDCGIAPYGSQMDEGAQEYEDYMAAQAALEALQEG